MNNIQLLDFQHEFITSTEKNVLLLGGIGTGKSFIGSHTVISLISQYPKSKGLIVANTYSQLINSTLQTLTQELKALDIPFELSLGAKKQINIAGTIVYLYSLEKPDNIRGIEVGWIWGDEICFAKKEAFDVIKGRLRDKNGSLVFRGTSSPNGFNWAYDLWGVYQRQGYKLIKAKTSSNIFLPEGYYSELIELYGGLDNPLAKQELLGDFVNLNAGAIYWAFNRNDHVRECKLNNDLPVYVGQDFNIENMCGVYVQFINNIFYVCSENILRDSLANTYTASEKIAKDLKDYKHFVIPDSTGIAVKSSSHRSDHQIMKDYGLTILPVRNPLIRDRQNAVNLAFKQGRLFVDPSCKELIKEIETISSRDKEGDVSHVAVSLGYVINKLSPVVRPQVATFRGY